MLEKVPKHLEMKQTLSLNWEVKIAKIKLRFSVIESFFFSLLIIVPLIYIIQCCFCFPFFASQLVVDNWYSRQLICTFKRGANVISEPVTPGGEGACTPQFFLNLLIIHEIIDQPQHRI